MAAAPDWDALRATLDGDVLTPDAPAYDEARRPAIPNFHDVRPRAVVRCRRPADVAEAIDFATRFGLPLAPRSGGHCFGGGSSTPGIVLDVGPMASVSVDGGIATVGAGTRLGALYDTLATPGLTIPAGCGPTVGVAGLVLGGGLGILGRTYGLTSDRLVGAEIILADGRVVRCDAERDPDFFWALRGAGGGRFGVVTSLDFATVPAPSATIFDLVWPIGRADRVVDAWQHWAPAAPDGLAASLLVRATGADEEPVRVHVFGAMAGSESDLTPLLDDLVVPVGAEPVSTYVRPTTHRESKQRLAELFPADEGANHLHSKSEFFERMLPPEAIERLLAHLAEGRTADESRTLDFMPGVARTAGCHRTPPPSRIAVRSSCSSTRSPPHRSVARPPGAG